MTNYQLLPNNLEQGFRGSKPVQASITQTFVRNEAKLTGFPSMPMGPWKEKIGEQIGDTVKAQHSSNSPV